MTSFFLPGGVAQLVTCLNADRGVANLNPARSHTSMEIDHKLISMVISSLPLNHPRRIVFSYKQKYVNEVVQT